MTGTWTWWGLAALGAYHGLNPAMGWLFAVARGLYERSTRTVVASLGPIAAGHTASLALVALVFGAFALAVDPARLRWGAAAALIGFGVFKLVRPRSHPRWTGMRVGGPALALWSLLMSTAHGAGLMLLPLLLASPPDRAGAGAGAAHGAAHGHAHPTGGGDVASTALALLVHTASMLAVMGVLAVVVHRVVGLEVLRRAWVNFDVVWACVLVLSGVFLLI
ncbi:hypothetical protein [Saccharothrix syringae]|uniref:Arginine/ornithine antiporter ArcD n=1 Tax=Saccharothrix syringae TaxID=103733 RepID=A0A5Q0GYA6_SACSY|nr:hypothetical protein [Saccharothrix syringae]QFZ18322.1 hypothetical protein EKG83_13250 [Saccharothrix syringae]